MQKISHSLPKKRTQFSILFLIILYLHGNNGNILNFYAILGSKMRRNPLDFNNYGRYCGLWGTGKTLDLLDKCCLEHDECYGSIAKKECYEYGSLAPFWVHYTWKILENDTIICADPTSNYFELCASKACECDVKVCDCFLNNQYLFNYSNRKTLMWRAFEEYFLGWLFPISDK